MSSVNPNLIPFCEDIYDEEEEDQEKSDHYVKGGYHCVQIGDTFCNKYRAIRKLGWGAFSTVWLCIDITLNEYFAIKIIKSSRSGKSALEEIRMLSAVKSADPSDPFAHRVVTLYDYFILNGDNGRHQCLVFEVLGDSLYKFMSRSFSNGIPIEAVKRIVRQILEALHYLHSKCKLIHTDIKPENILITTNKNKIIEMHSQVNHLIGICGKRQLPNSFISMAALNEDNCVTNEVQTIAIDFNVNENIANNIDISEANSSDIFDGISNLSLFDSLFYSIFDLKIEELIELKVKIVDLGNSCSSKDSNNFMIQTRPYRSPEVIIGLEFGPSADIWSLACTAFELATGDLLFNVNHKKKSSRSGAHLAKILGLLGPAPKVFRKGKKYYKYFGKKNQLLSYKVTQECSLDKQLTTKYGWAPTVAQSFAQFLLPMLQMDPQKRATTQECLSHHWLNF